MRTFLLSLIYLLSTGIGVSQDFNRIIKRTASDRGFGDRLGMAADISGGFAIIGASLEDQNALGQDSLPSAGSAYIFGRGLGGNWTEVQKLVPSDRAAQDRFGFSVAIDGERAVIGAPNKAIGGNNAQGAAYIFERQSNGDWIEVQKLDYNLGEAFDNFGNSVEISGDKVIIGAAFADPGGTKDAGRAHIYELNGNGNWVSAGVLTGQPIAQGASFGSSVAVDSNYLAVGAWLTKNNMPSTNASNAGAVHIFNKDNMSGQWSHIQRITPDSTDWVTGDLFGGTVALQGNTLVVGADGDAVDENLQNVVFGAGAVHIYEKDMSGMFTQVQKIVASDREEDASFGQKVAIAGDKILVGAPGESEKVGGINLNTSSFAGAAYLFEKDGMGNWTEVQRLLANDREEFDSFGFALGMTENYLLITSNQDDENAMEMDSISNSGSMYFFETCTIDNSVIQIGDSLFANMANVAYQWVDCDKGNAPIAGANGQGFKPDSAGNYAVELNDLGCYMTSACVQVIASSTSLKKEIQPFSLFPIPSKGRLNLQTDDYLGSIKVSVFHMDKLLLSQHFRGRKVYKIDLSDLPDGIYALRVEMNGVHYHQNFSLIH
ncbi:MAG: hypothetical protein MRZ79_11785 [Bacteroidia bacterium]|nr:hypothetical protein [Bacteroidia bacterium]